MGYLQSIKSYLASRLGKASHYVLLVGLTIDQEDFFTAYLKKLKIKTAYYDEMMVDTWNTRAIIVGDYADLKSLRCLPKTVPVLICQKTTSNESLELLKHFNKCALLPYCPHSDSMIEPFLKNQLYDFLLS